MAWTNRTIVMGFYQGIGDFLAAVPTANELLRNGNRVVMVASRPNVQLAELIAFMSPRVQLIELALFSKAPLRSLRLLNVLRRLRPDFVMVSPHAQEQVSSWKSPLLLWVLKHLAPGRPVVIGSQDEKLSCLYDVRLLVDKALGLIEREWSLHRMAGSIEKDAMPDKDVFNRAAVKDYGAPRYDLVVHPGASRDVKMWPVDYHRELVRRLDDHLRVAYIGRASELAPFRASLGGHRNVEFLVGPINEAVSVASGASVVLTMDSGFSYVAALLGVRHIALFGSTDPVVYSPPSQRSTSLYRKALPCQPCNQHACRLSHMACMRIITPGEVAATVEDALSVGASVDPVGRTAGSRSTATTYA